MASKLPSYIMAITSQHLANTAQAKQKAWNMFQSDFSIEVKRQNSRSEDIDYARWSKRMGQHKTDPLTYFEKVQICAMLFRTEMYNDNMLTDTPAHRTETPASAVRDEDIEL
jgi:nucleoid-associated protein YejK